MLNFGQRLLLARRRRGWNQTVLAKALDININTVSRAERSGVATMRGDTIAKIARALNVSADFLLGLSEEIGGEEST